VTVTDVVPTAADDPRGAGLGSAALPLVLAGLAGAVVLSLRVGGTGRRIAAALGLAVVAGAAITAVLQPWLGILEGSYLANAGVVALGIAAVVLPILGLVALLGPAGIGLGAAVMMLLGNPLSGAATAPRCCRPAGARSASSCRRRHRLAAAVGRVLRRRGRGPRSRCSAPGPSPASRW
jgi:hypothetical protein